MWRYDAGRTAASPETLPDQLHLAWLRQLPPQSTAWKDEETMKFDRSYEPVVVGKHLLVGSTVNDSLTAYDVETGARQWRFYADGPIRTAPAGWNDSVFVAADDGCLYCVAVADGKLRWRFRGGPNDRRLIGNERLISTWPARGGPVVADGNVYLAVGVWPFMGTFVYALDARTGRVLWVNDSTSFTWRQLPHYGSASFSGHSPQGHLAAVGDKLIVPGSRFQPAVFDRRTGEFLYYADGLGPEVAGEGRFGLAGGSIFELVRGRNVRVDSLAHPGHCVLAPDRWYTAAGVLDMGNLDLKDTIVEVPTSPEPDAPMASLPVLVGSVKRLSSGAGPVWLRAGAKLVVARTGEVQLFDAAKAAEAKPVWQGAFDGSPGSILSAGGRLFIVTLEGAIYCFGPASANPPTYPASQPAAHPPGAWAERVRQILQATGSTDGYCLVLGLADGGLVEELVRQSNLHVIAVDDDAAKVLALRRRLDAAGTYGARAAAIEIKPAAFTAVPYWASLIVSEDAEAAGLGRDEGMLQRIFRLLRPYGGVACLALPAQKLPSPSRRGAGGEGGLQPGAAKSDHISPIVPHPGPLPAGEGDQSRLADAEVKQSGAWTLLRRIGPPPG
ncbi:MAG: PQQ-binding-like beta-propeller repeat protein, partial [Thermoguttaceae bacterium]